MLSNPLVPFVSLVDGGDGLTMQEQIKLQEEVKVHVERRRFLYVLIPKNTIISNTVDKYDDSWFSLYYQCLQCTPISTLTDLSI